MAYIKYFYLLLILLCMSNYVLAGEENEVRKTRGQVSHEFREGGCPTVVRIQSAEGKDILLIPKDSLTPPFDIDGLWIKFYYRSLKMKNPFNCKQGIPVELKDLELTKAPKKKKKKSR